MLVLINKQVFDQLKEDWLQAVSVFPEDFPKEMYQRRIDYINPERTDKIALTNDYALLDNDETVIATMAIAHVGPKTPGCYLKFTEILISPRLSSLGDSPVSFVETMTRLFFSAFRLSESEMKATKIKFYGSSEQARLFFEALFNNYLQILEEGYTPNLTMGRHGPWLEMVKVQQGKA